MAAPVFHTPGTALYVCHCGHNIAGTVDVEQVCGAFADREGVTTVRHYPYLCSRPGQELIRDDLRAGRAGRVVVAACSPRMHEATFRKAVAAEGVNPYLFHQVNIREHCSWVHGDRTEATRKAADLVAMGLARVRLQEPLERGRALVTPRVLVLGGGPAGLAAAASLAAAGLAVVLVEAGDQLGGRPLSLSPDPDGDTEVPSWVRGLAASVQRQSRVRVLLSSRLVAWEGTPGNFAAGIATPGGPETVAVGAVVVAVGSALYRPDDPLRPRPELAFGTDPRILSQEDLERALRSQPGPLAALDRPDPSIVLVQCVGSRDRTAGAEYCSRTCCQVSVRQARELRKRHPEATVQVLYMDLRAYGRGAEEAYEAAGREGVVFRRGNPSEIFHCSDRLAVRFEDTLLGRAEELPADLVVLACGARPPAAAPELSQFLRVARDPAGFFLEAHPKLQPVEAASAGIYFAGACLGPRTVDEAVDGGRATAAKAAALLLQGRIEIDGAVAEIDSERCSGCALCVEACPTGAISPYLHTGRMHVEVAACRGCGACAAVCPGKAAVLRHHRTEQILAEVAAAGR